MTELQRAETIIRDALADLTHLTPDEIAEKIAADGMLWCDPWRRPMACPIHHYLEARLVAHGLGGIGMSVGTGEAVAIIPTPDGQRGRIVQPFPQSVSQFIHRYDRGDFKHLEVPA